MDMDLIIENIVRKDILNIINRIKKCHSKSMYNKLISDLSKLYEIANTLKLDNILDVDNYAYKTYSRNYRKIEKNQKKFYLENYDFHSELTDNYIYILNKYPNQNYRYIVDEMSIEESQNLAANFLKEYNYKIYETFKNCVMNNKFIYLDKKEYDFYNEGETYYGNYFNTYVLIENQESIFTALTSIHEVGHIYDFDNLMETNYNYLTEIYSHYLELIFGNYLKNKNIDCTNVKYNYLDNLEETVTDLSNLLKENITSKLDFDIKYNQIFYILEYTYGMILALEFYDLYLSDKELANYKINEFSKNKNDFKNPIDLIEKFNFDKEKILEGETLKKFIKRI